MGALHWQHNYNWYAYGLRSECAHQREPYLPGIDSSLLYGPALRYQIPLPHFVL